MVYAIMTNKGQHSNEMALNDIYYFNITVFKLGQLQYNMEIPALRFSCLKIGELVDWEIKFWIKVLGFQEHIQ